MSDTTSTQPNIRKYKIIIIAEAAVILLLLVLFITARTTVHTFVVEKEKMVTERQGMQKTLDSLRGEHQKMIAEYGYMTADMKIKDSTIQAQTAEIQKLIESNAGKNMIQKKLDYLRGITQDYVAQIDKLLKENDALKTEVATAQDDIKKEKDKNQTLSKDKDDLTQQITNAAVLQAYGVQATGIRFKSGGKKEEIVDKAKRTEKIKITFTLAKNPLVQPGPKKVYVRIARPDNAILQDGQSFEYQGKQIMYSLVKDVNYTGSPVNITMYYEKTDRIIAGSYNIAVFSDDQEIGQTTLVLK
jgi:cytochrome c556